MTEERRQTVVTWSAIVTAITIGVTIVTGSWSILNWLYRENNRLRAEVTEHRVQMAKDTVTRPELRDIMKEYFVQIDARLGRIEKRLEEPK